MKTKLLVLFTVFIDVLGIGIIIPVLPEYIHSFAATDAVVMLLFAVYAFFSFMSAPYLGSLSDRVGRRPILIASILSTAAGWFIFASAKSILVLFAGRIIDGLAAGNITAAQSALADIAKDDKERTVNMGLFGALFGIGFIIGPALGGLLALWGVAVPFYFVGGLAVVNALLAYFFLPETHKTKDQPKKVAINPFKPIIDGFRTQEMRGLFLIWFIFGTALSVQQGTFSLYAQSVFGMSVQVTAWLFAAVGVLIVLNQMLLVKYVWLPRFSKKALAYIMLIVFAMGMVAQSVPILIVFLLSLIATTISQGNLRMVFSSMIANANPNKRGEYLGISTSIMSLSMIVGPLIATIAYTGHPGVPFIISGALALTAYFVMKRVSVSH